MIKLLNVDLFPKEEFGLREVNFTLNHKDRVHFKLQDPDQLNSLFGILEGRYRPQLGRVFFDRDRPHTQSDRLLLGDKVYTQTVGKYWVLNNDVFFLGGEKKYKMTYMDNLKCKSIRHFIVHKLRGDEKLKFALLALLFQPNGLILISKLFLEKLDADMMEVFHLIHQFSGTIICYASVNGEGQDMIDQLHEQREIRTLEPPDWEQKEYKNVEAEE